MYSILKLLLNDPFGGCFKARDYGRSQQKEGMRSLFSALTSRTNWVGTPKNAPNTTAGNSNKEKDEIWVQRLGRDLEGILDGGRVEFLRNANNFSSNQESPYCAQLVAFIPCDVSPRNRVLLGWRRRRKGRNGGYFLTE